MVPADATFRFEGLTRDERGLSRGESGQSGARAWATRYLNVRQIEKEYREAGIVVNVEQRVPIDESGLAKVEYELLPLCSLKAKD